MSNTATQVDTSFIADLQTELTARRPELTDQVATVDAGLALRRPDGEMVLVAKGRFGCVVGWAVAGPGRQAMSPVPDEDVEGAADEVLRRFESSRV